MKASARKTRSSGKKGGEGGLRKTIVGSIDAGVLAFTAGRDIELDRNLIEVDCIGTAAHVTMLSRIPGGRILRSSERTAVVRELLQIIRRSRAGQFTIEAQDQDVHLAVERALTAVLGDVGKRVHTARSRNDQVAVDLRMYGRDRLLELADAAMELAATLVGVAARHKGVPMVGRTHLQPAMPGSVGLWASAHAESLIEDMTGVFAAFDVMNRCPLGSAASYGVPLPIRPDITAKLLGFRGPFLNVLCAGNARGKCESIALNAAAQVMTTLSRLAEDLILFTMPEFGYFRIPAQFNTGSSIMPQKNNPDIAELIRARARIVTAQAAGVTAVVQGLPSGYNRDLQETKGPFMDGLQTVIGCLKILAPVMAGLEVNRDALVAGFRPEVFATDRALELVARGMPFRDAYDKVKANLADLGDVSPYKAIRLKSHLGAPAGLDFGAFRAGVRAWRARAAKERRTIHKAISGLLGVAYPGL